MNEPSNYNTSNSTAITRASPSSVVLEDEIDLIELLSILKRSRASILLIVALCGLLSGIYAFTSVDIYRSEAVLVPAESSGAGASLGGQLGQAASFVGINIGEENRQVEYALAALRSREFIGQFIRRNNLAVPLMAGTWNANTRQSEVDSSIYDIQSTTWQGEFAPDGPSEWQLYNAFSGLFVVSQERQSSIIRVSFEWHDPVLAASWVNGLVDDVNELVKERDLAEANRAIEFSRGQLEATQLVEMQRIFYDIIEAQTKVVMLADVRDEYVFQVIDKAVVPEDKVAPRRFTIMLGGLLGGFILGVMVVLFKNYFRAAREREVAIRAR